MLTYELQKAPGIPLYEALYRCIRADILSGTLLPGERMPSKRTLAANLEVSKITVEAAYAQLLAEGYIRAEERVGYFVEHTPRLSAPKPPAPPVSAPAQRTPEIDLSGGGAEKFPFSVWSRLQREVMLDYGERLLLPLPPQGVPELREAIAAHLLAFRGMAVDPENILVGAGTDFLYGVLVELLGRDRIYAVEDPGYGKIRRIYAAGGATCIGARMDGSGVIPELLGSARVLHLSASHHFPTGIVTPMERRLALLRWAKKADGCIVEDDYDSEFRFDAHPMPAMTTLDGGERVIYMNTFSKSLAPSIRIGYMVLPPEQMALFRQKLGFYGCTVSSFEQYTLARFLSRGQFERHINRMRKFYRARRNRLMETLRVCPAAEKLTVREADAGLHFLLQLDTPLSDEELIARFARAGVHVRTLGSYYLGPVPPEDRRCLVINYAGLREDAFSAALEQLQEIL